jgi:CheY-like chemotaxis protein
VSGEPIRVLVADDHPLIARLLTRTFEDAGYQVAVESAADRVAEAAAREQVDLAVVDANMTPCERFHALRALRSPAELKGAAPPAVIALSGDDAPAMRQQALKLGADAFLAKPWDPDELLELAARLTSAGRSGGG